MKGKLTKIIIGTTLGLFTALPALADQCSPNQRVPLPGCVRARGVDGGTVVFNNCNHAVTIKVDIADARDKLVAIPAKARFMIPINGRFQLKCCPRYNRC